MVQMGGIPTTSARVVSCVAAAPRLIPEWQEEGGDESQCSKRDKFLMIYKSKTFVLYKNSKCKKTLDLSQWYIAISGRKNKLQLIVF